LSADVTQLYFSVWIRTADVGQIRGITSDGTRPIPSWDLGPLQYTNGIFINLSSDLRLHITLK